MSTKITKEEKIAALTEAGVELTGEETPKELNALYEENLASKEDDSSEQETEELTLEERVAVLEKTVSELVQKGQALPNTAVALGHTVGAHKHVPFTGKEEEAEESVTFHLNDKAVKSRTFSKADHGDDFNEVANEFHKTNEKRILKRDQV